MIQQLTILLDLLPMAIAMGSVYLCVWLGRVLHRKGWPKTGAFVAKLPILLLLGAAVMLIVGM